MTYPKNSFELRYLIVALPMLWLYWQYAVVYLCMNSRAKWPLAVVWVPLGVAFALQNIAFNLTCGTFLYWQRPRQWYFSDRIRQGSEERKERFRRLLNPYDPDHIA